MGFLNENNSLTYFTILGELSAGLVFNRGLFQDLRLFLITIEHYQGARKDIPTYNLIV